MSRSRLTALAFLAFAISPVSFGASENPAVSRATLKLLQDQLLKTTDEQKAVGLSRSILNEGARALENEAYDNELRYIDPFTLAERLRAGARLGEPEEYYIGFWLLR